MSCFNVYRNHILKIIFTVLSQACNGVCKQTHNHLSHLIGQFGHMTTSAVASNLKSTVAVGPESMHTNADISSNGNQVSACEFGEVLLKI